MSSKFFFFFIVTTYLIANPFDRWVDQNNSVIEAKIKLVSFQIKLESDIESKEHKILNGKIVIGENKQFRFEIGKRTVVSDGVLWRSYDERTDQIFIQGPNKKIEKALFSWVKVKRLKALPIINKPDGSCKIKLLGNNNDVWAYFNPNTNILDSIMILQLDGFRSKIFNINISIADSVNLNLGTQSSNYFDLR